VKRIGPCASVVMLISKPPSGMPDCKRERHASWRRYTRKYRNKRRIVRDMWILVGAAMINAPFGVVLGLGLLSVLVSFAILDETR
jgi:hypothetical protein